MNEISLIIQSVCLEAAVGMMLFLALGRLWKKDLNGKLATLAASILAVVGVITSITHLGQPQRALNALFNLGSSWLSRETLCVALFTGCTVLCLIVAFWKPALKTVIRVLEIGSAVIGAALLYIMASIYTSASVPVWAGANTYIAYYTTAIVLGALLLFAITLKQQDRRGNMILGAIAFGAMALQIVSSELHGTALGSSGDAALMSAGLLAENRALVIVKWALLLFGVGLFALKGVSGKTAGRVAVTAGGPQASAPETVDTVNVYVAWLSVCAVVIAALIEKVLFFASMVVTGSGLS